MNGEGVVEVEIINPLNKGPPPAQLKGTASEEGRALQQEKNRDVAMEPADAQHTCRVSK